MPVVRKSTACVKLLLAPLKVMALELAVVTKLFTATLPAKVVPPLLVIVSVPMSVPTAP